MLSPSAIQPRRTERGISSILSANPGTTGVYPAPAGIGAPQRGRHRIIEPSPNPASRPPASIRYHAPLALAPAQSAVGSGWLVPPHDWRPNDETGYGARGGERAPALGAGAIHDLSWNALMPRRRVREPPPEGVLDFHELRLALAAQLAQACLGGRGEQAAAGGNLRRASEFIVEDGPHAIDLRHCEAA